MDYVTQALGFLATLLMFLSYQANNRKVILAYQIGISICMTLHYGLLSAFSAMIINIICLIRNILFSYRERHTWANNNALPLTIITAEIISVVLTWRGITDLLALAGAPLQTAALWSKAPKAIRIMMLIASPLWLIYDFFNGSWSGMFMESVVICSLLIAMWRYDRRRQS